MEGFQASGPGSSPILAAYRYCEVVTGQRARNFAYGLRLLPTPKRRAVSAGLKFMLMPAHSIDSAAFGGVPKGRVKPELAPAPKQKPRSSGGGAACWPGK